MQGNLLDDTELIDVLSTTKQTSQDVAEKLANASETNAKITEACEEFRPVAHRATLLYFLIAEFTVVNCMYQTSLAQFTKLYEQAIDRSERATMPSKRIHNIIDYMTYEIYLYVQRGLFERHKLLFALMLANKILASARVIRLADVDVFLKGGGALDIASVRKKPKDWIPDNVWLAVVALAQLETFRDIPDSVFRNDGLWKQWCERARAPSPPPPCPHVPQSLLCPCLAPWRSRPRAQSCSLARPTRRGPVATVGARRSGTIKRRQSRPRFPSMTSDCPSSSVCASSRRSARTER